MSPSSGQVCYHLPLSQRLALHTVTSGSWRRRDSDSLLAWLCHLLRAATISKHHVTLSVQRGRTCQCSLITWAFLWLSCLPSLLIHTPTMASNHLCSFSLSQCLKTHKGVILLHQTSTPCLRGPSQGVGRAPTRDSGENTPSVLGLALSSIFKIKQAMFSLCLPICRF